MEQRQCLLEEYILLSQKNKNRAITRNQAYVIIKNAAKINGLPGNISCHSLRKTFGYHAWKQGIPPAVIMEIYNHSSMEMTKRYLFIDQDERDEVFYSIVL